jgi:hypothetical protein
MTVEEEVLGRLVELLGRLSIPYMVTGSIAASYYGRPRATHDADLVIDPSAAQADALIAALETGGFYVNGDAARRAVRERSQFNAIEIARAAKVDLAFARGLAIVTPEDAILSKLEWARSSGDSERQIRDAAGIVELSPAIDRTYVRRWAIELGVLDLWERISPPR